MDEAILQLINQRWTNPVLDLLMASLSASEIWKPLLILIVLLALVFGRFKARACLVCLLHSLFIAEQGNSFLKMAIDRRRAKQVETVRMVELARVKPAFLKMFYRPTIR